MSIAQNDACVCTTRTLFRRVVSLAFLIVAVPYAVAIEIPLSDAVSETIPAVDGDGFFVEIFLGVGGGVAPHPDHIDGSIPDGELLSPRIDFPHPGSVVNINTSFDVFFADTVVPPDHIRALAPQRFILRNTGLLKITEELDRFPGTPEIDIRIGIGCDDGHYLVVGSHLLGTSPDHGFTYYWYDLEFEGEGLYPLYFLFAANAVGQSGLEFSWQTAGGSEILPQDHVYQMVPECDTDIYFEEYVAGMFLTDQYRDLGALFDAQSGILQITDARPGDFVPVSGDRVFGDPDLPPGAPGVLEMTFVVPGTDYPAATSYFSCYVIDAEAIGATITAYDKAGTELFTEEYHAGGATQEHMDISATGIHRIVFTLGQDDDTSAIDNVCFLSPYLDATPDLEVTTVGGPDSGLVGEPFTADWTVINNGDYPAVGSWVDAVYISPDDEFGNGNDTLLGEVTHDGDLAPAESYPGSAGFTLPDTPGEYWLIVVTDAGDAVDEDQGEDNNTTISAAPIIVGPFVDLEVTDISAPCWGTQGEAFEVTWTVTNYGPDSYTGTWSDEIRLSDDTTEGDDTPLGSFVYAGTLGAGEGYTQSETVTLPGAVQGEHWVIVVTDVNNEVIEFEAESNNLSFDDVSFRIHPPGVVDLCAWAEVDYHSGGDGNWVVAGDGLSVHQTINGDPTYFVSDFELASSQFQGRFMVQSSAGDDDYIGFTFGFLGLGGTGAGEGYYLFSWKKGNQSTGNGYGEKGFKLMKIIGTAPNLWDGEETPGQIVMLARDTSAPAPGWTHGVEYDFFLTYQANGNIRVIIRRADTQEEMWNTGLVNDPAPLGPGKVGFWNYSQPHVIYSGFTQAALQPPVAVAGGPYVFDAATLSVTADATDSFDPDGANGTFEDIEAVQWDLGNDGIDDDLERVNPLQLIDLAEATLKGLAIGTDVALGLEVTDVDGLTDDALTSLSYQSTVPAVDAGGPYGPVGPGEDIAFAGFVDDLDLPLDVGEALTVEWDFAPATVPGDIGDGFASEPDAVVSYETLLPLVAEHGDIVYLNVADVSGLVASSMTTVALLAPDLTVTTMDHATQAYQGETIEVTWEVLNDGDIAAEGAWIDRVYLSDDDQFDAGDTPLAPFAAAGPLLPEETYPGSALVDMPGEPGDYWLIIVTDANDDVGEGLREDNNVLVSDGPITIELTPRPDLIVTSVVGPLEVIAGETVTVSWTVLNDGDDEAAGTWSDRVYLSDDDVLGGDITLDTFEQSGPLAIDTTYTADEDVTIPFDVEGDYYFLVVTDYSNAVIEGLGEGNNDRFADQMTGVTQPPLPDLDVISLTIPDAGFIGTEIEIDWEVTNIGDLPAEGTWRDRIYLSTNDQLDPEDTVIGGHDVEGPLAVDASYIAGESIYLPALPNDYWIIIVANDFLNVEEGTGRANNVRVSAASITVSPQPKPDLLVTAVSTPVTAAPGDTVELTWTVANQGAINAAGTWSEQVLASADAELGDDVLLANFIYEGNDIAPGGDELRIEQIPVPNMPEGYYVIVCVDSSHSQPEEDETNNCGFSDAAAAVARPDLVVTSIVAPTAADADQEVQIEWTVRNDGAATAPPTWLDTIYLSGDDLLGDDIVIASRARVSLLGPGEQYTQSYTVTVPGRIEGDYTFLVMADSMDLVLEDGDDANNVLFADGPTTITQPDRPNLIVTDITAPPDGLVGQPMQVSWQVTNIGPVEAPSPWTDRVIARLEDGGDEILLGEFFRTTSLPAGEFYDRSAAVDYPALAGEFRLIVTTDRADHVNEGLAGGESDNTLVDDETFMVATYIVSVQTDLDEALAGTPVVLYGQATSIDTGDPLPNKPVQIGVQVQDTLRLLETTTDGAGDYTVVFQPLGNEAGRYELTAGPPRAIEPTVQDTFLLWGLGVNLTSVSVEVYPGGSRDGQIKLINYGDVALTGVTVTQVDVPGDLTVEAPLSDTTIPPLGSVTVDVTITAAPDQTGNRSFSLDYTTDQGPTGSTAFNVLIRSPQPHLVATPTSLSAEMVRGQQTLIELQVRNIGAATAENLQVSLPPGATWLQLGSTIPDLEPDKSATVLLHLLPDDDLPLGPYSGTIVVEDAGHTYGVSVPYNFVATSDQLTAVRVRVADEATFWSTGVYDPDGPQVAGAVVRLLNPYSGELVAEGTTARDDYIEFPNVPEGPYQLRINAANHAAYREVVHVEAEEENYYTGFIPRETVRYNWTVTETEIEDVYVVTLEALFETNVPSPVVTIDPPMLDLAQITEDVGQMDFTITNHGLIAAEQVSFSFGDNPHWQITPLVEDLGDLGPQQSVVVPVIIERLDKHDRTDPEDCVITAGVDWSLVCIGRIWVRVPVIVFNVSGDCGLPVGGGGGGGGGGWWGGGGAGGPGNPFSIIPGSFPPVECDLCDPDDYEPEDLLSVDVSDLFAPVEAGVESVVTAYTGGAVQPDVSIEAEGGARTCCNPDGTVGFEIYASASAGIEIQIGPALSGDVGFEYGLNAIDPGFLPAEIGITTPLDVSVSGNASGMAGAAITPYANISGEVTSGCNFSGEEVHAAGAIGITGFLGATAAVGAQVSGPGFSCGCEGVADLNLNTGAGFTFNYDNGDWSWDGCFDGVYFNTGLEMICEYQGQEFPFTAVPPETVYLLDRACINEETMRDAIDLELLGRQIDAEIRARLRENLPRYICISRVRPLAERLHRDRADGEGVCAEVRLQLEQEVAITRTAFTAQLEIFNPDETLFVDEIFVEFDIFDEDGNLATNLFAVDTPQLFNLSAVDGTGELPPASIGTVSWLIVPTRYAAPVEPIVYYVSGLFSYRQGEVTSVVPLQPTAITVRPDPRLLLKYFWQRDVFADDPFTEDVIEPSEPFSLGLIMTNEGYGPARNMRITSGQPEIIENERQLLIAFELIGAQVGTEEINPSLTVNFGDIEPAGVAVARWLMTSTLQGQFTEYSAEFEHVNDLGDPRISLIDSVDIFELIHVVRADEPEDDLLPDFMTNEVEHPDDPYEDPEDPDRKDLPDNLHLSDSSIEPVTPVLDAAVTSDPELLEAQVTVTMPTGWAYIKFPDPFDGTYPLMAVVRSDAKELVPAFNAWQTDRTFREGEEQPLRQHRIHLFDRDGTGEYTLYFTRVAIPPAAPAFGQVTTTKAWVLSLGALNLPDTEHALFEEVTGQYVGPDGTLQAAPHWLQRDAWIGIVVRGLTPETEYSFKSQARLEDLVESDFGLATPVTTAAPGDINCDGNIDVDDIDQFVLALSGPAAYDAQHPNCDWLNADCNADGYVDFDDIDPFVALLSGG